MQNEDGTKPPQAQQESESEMRERLARLMARSDELLWQQAMVREEIAELLAALGAPRKVSLRTEMEPKNPETR